MSDFIEKIPTSYEHWENLRNIAYELAKDAHKGQTRRDGRDYFLAHPKVVADSIVKYFQDNNDLEKLKSPILKKMEIVGLMHDVFEDTDLTQDEVEDIFGDEILQILFALSERAEYKEELKKESDDKKWIKIMLLEDSLRRIDELKETSFKDAWEIASTVRIADILQNTDDYSSLSKDLQERNLLKVKRIINKFDGKISLVDLLKERLVSLGGEKE